MWLAANGWELVDSDNEYILDWRRGEDAFAVGHGLSILLRDVKFLANVHGRTLASVLEEIMVPDP